MNIFHITGPAKWATDIHIYGLKSFHCIALLFIIFSLTNIKYHNWLLLNFSSNPRFIKLIWGKNQCLTPEWQFQVLSVFWLNIIGRHCRHIPGEICCHCMQIEVQKKWSNTMKGKIAITFQGKPCSWISANS